MADLLPLAAGVRGSLPLTCPHFYPYSSCNSRRSLSCPGKLHRMFLITLDVQLNSLETEMELAPSNEGMASERGNLTFG
jgi:hypothetical protein